MTAANDMREGVSRNELVQDVACARRPRNAQARETVHNTAKPADEQGNPLIEWAFRINPAYAEAFRTQERAGFTWVGVR